MSQTVKRHAIRWKGETSLQCRVTKTTNPDPAKIARPVCHRTQQTLNLSGRGSFGLNPRSCTPNRQVVGYPSGQRGQTVNLLAYAFAGSNPAPTTILI